MDLLNLQTVEHIFSQNFIQHESLILSPLKKVDSIILLFSVEELKTQLVPIKS